MKNLAGIIAVGVAVAALGLAGRSFADHKSETKTGGTGYIADEGAQSWPTSSNAPIDQAYSIPIYLGLPNKAYKVLGRVIDERQEGFDVVGKAFDEGLGSEQHRFRNVANQAKFHGADAVVVTSDPKVLEALKLTDKQVQDSAPLFRHRHSVALAVKF